MGRIIRSQESRFGSDGFEELFKAKIEIEIKVEAEAEAEVEIEAETEVEVEVEVRLHRHNTHAIYLNIHSVCNSPFHSSCNHRYIRSLKNICTSFHSHNNQTD